MASSTSGASTPPDVPTSDHRADLAGRDGGEPSDHMSGDTIGDRRRLPTVLVVVATVLAVLSTLTTWVRVQALETDSWVDLSGELLEQPEVQAALSAYLVDQLYESLDLSAEIESALPTDFDGLAGTLAAALRGPATDAVERLIATDAFQSTWTTINRATHRTLVAVLRDEVPTGLSTADGDVTLDLRELLIVTARELGLSGDRIEALPEDAGQLTIFSSDDLSAVQTGVQLLDFLSWFLLLVVAGLYALAVYLAAGHRVRVLRRVGIAIIIGGAAVLLLRSLAVRLLIDAAVENPLQRPVAVVTASVSTALIEQMGWSAIIYGIIIVGVALLIGDAPQAAWIRNRLAPLAAASTATLAGAGIAALLVLIWWNPRGAFDRLATSLVLIAVLAAAAIAVKRRIQLDAAATTI